MLNELTTTFRGQMITPAPAIALAEQARGVNDVSDTDALAHRLISIIEAVRNQVTRSVNSAMLQAYLHFGREIDETEKQGEVRARYGDAVVKRVADHLTTRFGRGFSYPTVKRMKQFHVAYPNGSTVPGVA